MQIYRMYGDIAQLLRYKIAWKDTEGCEQEEYCISEEHRDEVIQRLGDATHTVEAIDQSGNGWIDGMAFPDASQVPDALAMGEAAWRQAVNGSDINLQFCKYLTDLDFRLLSLELGV